MKTKPILVTLGVTVIYFLLGWLVYGILLMDYYNSHLIQYKGLMKEPAPWVYFIGNLCSVGLLIYVFTLAEIKTLQKGAVVGMILFLLITLSFDLMLYSGMNLYTGYVFFVDIIVAALFGGLLGGLGGLFLGMGKKE
jgi:hypothetical protein